MCKIVYFVHNAQKEKQLIDSLYQLLLLDNYYY